LGFLFLGICRDFIVDARIKHVQSTQGIFEFAWAPDGRATFQHGKAVIEGEAHVVWRRIGGHEIFDTP
jgi:hypothetical protein